MRGPERGFLLLSSCLGDPARRPLTTAQLRTLADRSWQADPADFDREIQAADLMALGYGPAMAAHICSLLSQEDVLEHYLHRGHRAGCVPLTRVSPGYPLVLRKRLGLDSPGVLWAKGDLKILNDPKIALVGSRELEDKNRRFAEEAGRQAALQGCTLVSGNARGADRTAQAACLESGGSVICVVADELSRQPLEQNVLYLSEDDFDAPFTAQRAIRRNRVIHALVEKTFVAQCSLHHGGTWDGTVKNLRFGWSGVYCFADGSPAAVQLTQLGAEPIQFAELSDFTQLDTPNRTLFDR